MVGDIDRMIKELSGGERVARTRAVEDLVRAGTAAVPQLWVVARDGRWLTRLHAMLALARIGEPRVVPLIREALADRDDQVRVLAAEAAGAIRDEGSIRQLCRCLATRDSDQREKFGQALLRIGRPAVPDLIRTAAQGPDPARVAAIRTLRQIGDRGAVPTLRAVLQERKIALQITALDALVEFQDRDTAPQVVELYRSGRLAVTECQLVSALCCLAHPVAVPLLLEMIAEHGGSAAFPRRPALDAIRRIGVPGIPELLRNLDNQYTAEVAGEALLLLLNDVPVIPGLEEMRKHGSGTERQRATAILLSTGRLHIDGIPFLVSALEDPIQLYRLLAARGLSRIAESTPDPQLRAALAPLRAGARWYYPASQQWEFQTAIRAIEAATANIAAMPAPASAPPSALHDLPVPGTPSETPSSALPRTTVGGTEPP